MGETHGVPIAGGGLQRLEIGQCDRERADGGQLYRVVVGRQGLFTSTWDGCICVNMNGERLGDEYASNHSNEGYEAQDKFVSSALGSAILDKGTDHTRRAGGPIWAIFDQSFADSERF